VVEVENKKKRVYGRESEKVTNKTKKKHKKTYNYKQIRDGAAKPGPWQKQKQVHVEAAEAFCGGGA